jgi:hypothetical protein
VFSGAADGNNKRRVDEIDAGTEESRCGEEKTEIEVRKVMKIIKFKLMFLFLF